MKEIIFNPNNTITNIMSDYINSLDKEALSDFANDVAYAREGGDCMEDAFNNLPGEVKFALVQLQLSNNGFDLATMCVEERHLMYQLSQFDGDIKDFNLSLFMDKDMFECDDSFNLLIFEFYVECISAAKGSLIEMQEQGIDIGLDEEGWGSWDMY